MAQLPAFKSSGNGANDLKQLQVANILGMGYWKGQIVSRSKKAVGHPSVDGHAVIPNIRIDGEMKLNTAYGQKVKSFLEILGLDDEAINEINGIWNQSRVDGITLRWRESLTNNKETFKIFFGLMKDSLPEIAKIEVRYTNLTTYPTTTPEIDRIAYEEIWLASTLLQDNSEHLQFSNKNTSTNDLMETGSIKAFDSLDVEIPLSAEQQIVLKGLMIVDGLNVLGTSIVSKEGELAVYNDDLTPIIIGYRPNALITYTGTGIQLPSDEQIDEFVDNYESITSEESEYIVKNFASTFWELTETTSETSIWFSQTRTFNKFTKKFFSIDGENVYPRIDMIRTATAEELIHIMSNYIEIDIHQETKWYDGVVKFIGGIINGITQIIRFVDDIFRKISPVAGFILNLMDKSVAYLINFIFGKDYTQDDVRNFMLDNSVTIIVTIFTWGAWGAVAGGLSALATATVSFVTLLVNMAVEILSIISGLLAQMLYLLGIALEYMLTAVLSSVTTVSGILKQVVDIGSEVSKQMDNAKEQAEFDEEMRVLEEKISESEEEERLKKATFNLEKDMQKMYTDDFDLLGKLIIPNQFDNGQIFDIQKQIERRY